MSEYDIDWFSNLSDLRPSNNPFVLLKFCGTEKRANDVKNGDLFANPVKYFIDLEKKTGNRGQGDKNENHHTITASSGEVYDDNGHLIGYIEPNTDLEACYPQDMKIPIVCFMGFRLNEMIVSEDKQNSLIVTFPFTEAEIARLSEEFGSYCAVVSCKSLEKQLDIFETNNPIGKTIKVYHQMVDYYPANALERTIKFYMGMIPGRKDELFVKDDDLTYQREYRVVFDAPLKSDKKGCSFPVGSPENAEVFDSIDIPKIRFTIPRDVYEKAKEDTPCNPAN